MKFMIKRARHKGRRTANIWSYDRKINHTSSKKLTKYTKIDNFAEFTANFVTTLLLLTPFIVVLMSQAIVQVHYNAEQQNRPADSQDATKIVQILKTHHSKSGKYPKNQQALVKLLQRNNAVLSGETTIEYSGINNRKNYLLYVKVKDNKSKENTENGTKSNPKHDIEDSPNYTKVPKDIKNSFE